MAQLISIVTFAQQVTAPVDIESHINQVLISRGEEADNQSYYELLMQFYHNPIDINSCSSSELGTLQLLSNAQISQLIKYRDTNGAFDNKYELLSISSLSVNDIKKALPFISFNKPIKLKEALKKSITLNNNYLLISGSTVLEPNEGQKSNKFAGDPFQLNFRLKMVNPGHSSLGITLQKDPGELLFRTDSLYTGTDFYSFHYYIQNQGALKQLALGDFKLQFGQGLLLGSGFLVGKNASSITSIQTTIKIQPYTSLTEFNYFRGAGATLAVSPNWEVSLFYSNQQKDANINGSDENASISSLRTDGLHRTISELNAQNSVIEQVVGTALTFNTTSVELGILGLYNKFNMPFMPKNSLANIYKFSGQENYNVSVFGRYNYKNITLYGEAARTIKFGYAINLGVIASLSKKVDFSFQYRNLSPDFHSFYGVSFAENSSIANERGAYWGVNIKLTPSLTLMGYFDMYKFPWLKPTIPNPSTGSDGFFRINYKLKKSALFYMQIQSELKEKSIAGTIVKETQLHRLVKYVVNMDYNLESNISFRSRLQWTKSYFEENETGLLLYQDINVKIRRITFSSRYAIFDTGGFLSRQYTYEKGVLYTFNTPQFSGKGARYYIVAKYAPIKNLTLRAKWSQTTYYDRIFIGSGNSLIEGNNKTQITLQLKYSF